MAENRIKELRNEAKPKITLKKLSEMLNEKGLTFTDSQLSKFEKGKSFPRNSEIWGVLAEIFDVSEAYLLGYADEKKEILPTIADRLKALRKEKKLLQKDVAEAIGVSKITVSHWESGETFPSYENIEKLAEFFKVPSPYLTAMGLRRYGAIDAVDFALYSEHDLLKGQKELLTEMKDRGFRRGDERYDDEFNFTLEQEERVKGLINARKVLDAIPDGMDIEELTKFLYIIDKLNESNINELINFAKYRLSVQQSESSNKQV